MGGWVEGLLYNVHVHAVHVHVVHVHVVHPKEKAQQTTNHKKDKEQEEEKGKLAFLFDRKFACLLVPQTKQANIQTLGKTFAYLCQEGNVSRWISTKSQNLDPFSLRSAVF